MASLLIDTLLRVLEARHPQGEARENPTVHDVILELLSRNHCRIRERVTTTSETQAVHLLGVRGHGERPLWLVSSILGGGQLFDATPRYDETTGRIHGAGSASGCGDLVVKILAAARVPLHEMKRPVCIAALEGLESQRDAALDLVDAPATGAGVALVGAATELALWTEHPGALTLKVSVEREARHRRMPPMLDFYDVRVDGRGAHCLTPGDSVSAIERTGELLKELRERGQTRLLAIDAGEGADRVATRARMTVATRYPLEDLPQWAEASPLPDGASVPFPVDDLHDAWSLACEAGLERLRSTDSPPGDDREAGRSAHVGRLVSRLNRVESLMTLPTDLETDPQEVMGRFAEAAREALSEYENLELQVSLLDNRPPLSAHSQPSEWLDEVQSTLRQMELPAQGRRGSLTSDAGHLQRSGVPAIVFGPGRSSDLFTMDESVSLTELERALEFYESMIRRWCT
jgi:acetylornithine deacetylase/succinyl-diaminopimelate desuccinylase-like protein